MDELAQWLRSQRSTTQQDVDATEQARDARRGEYVAHHGAHHFNSESRH